jgi:hypothetical protein
MPRGPLPDPNAIRRNKPTIPTTDLPADGRQGPAPEPPAWAGNAKAVKQARAYVGLRDATRALIREQLSSDATDEQIAELRRDINSLYDDYVAKYGPVNKRASSYLSDDTDFPLLLALEDSQSSLVETVIAKGARKGQKLIRKVTEWIKSKIFFVQLTISKLNFPRLFGLNFHLALYFFISGSEFEVIFLQFCIRQLNLRRLRFHLVNIST